MVPDRMILLAGFIEVLLKALVLVGTASGVGGVVFCLLVLRPLDRDSQEVTRCLKTSLILIACAAACSPCSVWQEAYSF